MLGLRSCAGEETGGAMNEAIEMLSSAIEAGGTWYAVAVAVVVVIVRIYRQPAMQGLLPPESRWDALPKLARLVIVLVVALGAAWVAALLAGQSPLAALLAALPVALSAVATHKVTQAIGYAHTSAQTRKDLGYKPGSIRTALDPILPIDRERVERANSIARRAKV